MRFQIHRQFNLAFHRFSGFSSRLNIYVASAQKKYNLRTSKRVIVGGNSHRLASCKLQRCIVHMAFRIFRFRGVYNVRAASLNANLVTCEVLEIDSVTSLHRRRQSVFGCKREIREMSGGEAKKKN